jgi:TatD DNase family protein
MVYSLVDVHAHLDDEEFERDRERVILEARERGILVISSGCCKESNRKTLEISQKHPNILPTFGFDPWSSAKLGMRAAMAELDFIKSKAEEMVGIGEIGLDFKLGRKAIQRKAFELFLRLAEELGKPAIIHSRAAAGSVLEMLKKFAGTAVLHSFPGSIPQIRKAIELGCYFSIAPNVVRSQQKQILAREVPIEEILLESDSPSLGPDPRQRNEPVNIKIALKEIARIKGLSIARAKRIIFNNSKQLFNL